MANHAIYLALIVGLGIATLLVVVVFIEKYQPSKKKTNCKRCKKGQCSCGPWAKSRDLTGNCNCHTNEKL